jgi:putative transposase
MIGIDMLSIEQQKVSHPIDWDTGGYKEIQRPPQRYRIIDQNGLMALWGVNTFSDAQRKYRQMMEHALRSNNNIHDPEREEGVPEVDKET